MYTLLPLYLTEAFGVTILSAALTLALCRVGAIFGSFTTGTLSDRFPAGIMIMALLSANCILLLVFVTLQLDASMIAVLMGLGFISSSFFPLTFKLIADRTPQESRPPVTGFFMTTSLLIGGALAPLILGGAADIWDHRTAYLIPAVMSGAGALFVIATTRFRD
jgi:MFS family permease